VKTEPILQIESLKKKFDAICALENADFELLKGEIHALAGENGAGKSTLIKIMSGIHSRDGGRIRIDGNEVQIETPAAAQDLGISVIYQDFDLAPNLSVAHNLLLGREPKTLLGLINGKECRKLARRFLGRVGLEIDTDSLVGRLTVAQRQLVAIAKAISLNTRILVMDEPTSALASDEVEHLLGLVVKLKQKDTSIIFVSHKLDEIFRICDRITVFRDGKSIGTRGIAETSTKEIISMMVGRNLQDLFSKENHVQSELLLEARAMQKRAVINDISFSLRKGEILGIFGLKGAGRAELARTLFGLETLDNGELFLEGESVKINSPQKAIKRGIGFIPEDRKTQGLFPNMDVKENLSISVIDTLSDYGFINGKKERKTATEYISRLKIRTTGPGQMIAELSGGNQQKIILARWLACMPKVLIMHEPTAGIDIGARSEIYKVLNDLVAGGIGIMLLSSDLPEVLGLCDQILVMHAGCIVARFLQSEATEEKVMHSLVSGHSASGSN
jgi:ribose transport system ATP-binding protein